MNLLGKAPFSPPRPESVASFDLVMRRISERVALPPVPQAISWKRSIADANWNNLGNDTVGDCTVAAACHMVMCWSDNTQAEPWTFQTSDTVADFNDYKTSPDSATLQNILYDWKAFGVHRQDRGAAVAVKIDAYALLNLNDAAALKVQVQRTIQLFGGCYFGILLPKFAVKYVDGKPGYEGPMPPDWNLTNAQLDAKGADAARDPKAGHCVPAIGFDANGLQVVTWGQLAIMSWDFFARYRDEAWAVLCKSAWVKGDGTTPSGLTSTELVQDFDAITT